ncbi:hypothetical protein CKAN_00452800 [Cinnamomum micranthum f. kanehirae]|uniref:Uncharacterized protein n=1 Tax=Cinnamomum micranthum f. kanehirae TaxID=337451 RepID=A0A3S4NEI2_9MAGN|nr:hypothetical protein CKAN_00452800 [Cinnamomum micranthum f. kanehirae]
MEEERAKKSLFTPFSTSKQRVEGDSGSGATMAMSNGTGIAGILEPEKKQIGNQSLARSKQPSEQALYFTHSLLTRF